MAQEVLKKMFVKYATKDPELAIEAGREIKDLGFFRDYFAGQDVSVWRQYKDQLPHVFTPENYLKFAKQSPAWVEHLDPAVEEHGDYLLKLLKEGDELTYELKEGLAKHRLEETKKIAVDIGVDVPLLDMVYEQLKGEDRKAFVTEILNSKHMKDLCNESIDWAYKLLGAALANKSSDKVIKNIMSSFQDDNHLYEANTTLMQHGRADLVEDLGKDNSYIKELVNDGEIKTLKEIYFKLSEKNKDLWVENVQNEVSNTGEDVEDINMLVGLEPRHFNKLFHYLKPDAWEDADDLIKADGSELLKKKIEKDWDAFVYFISGVKPETLAKLDPEIPKIHASPDYPYAWATLRMYRWRNHPKLKKYWEKVKEDNKPKAIIDALHEQGEEFIDTDLLDALGITDADLAKISPNIQLYEADADGKFRAYNKYRNELIDKKRGKSLEDDDDSGSVDYEKIDEEMEHDPNAPKRPKSHYPIDKHPELLAELSEESLRRIVDGRHTTPIIRDIIKAKGLDWYFEKIDVYPYSLPAKLHQIYKISDLDMEISPETLQKIAKASYHTKYEDLEPLLLDLGEEAIAFGNNTNKQVAQTARVLSKPETITAADLNFMRQLAPKLSVQQLKHITKSFNDNTSSDIVTVAFDELMNRGVDLDVGDSDRYLKKVINVNPGPVTKSVVAKLIAVRNKTKKAIPSDLLQKLREKKYIARFANPVNEEKKLKQDFHEDEKMALLRLLLRLAK